MGTTQETLGVSTRLPKNSTTKRANENTLNSSFKGVYRYTGERGKPFPNVFEWLEVKRRDDNIGNNWRVHDKLYNLEAFIDKHPGGRDWIEFSRGTDITEAFEASHIVNVGNVERTLEQYYVADATTPRNSPYTFKENGFYKTLKRRAEPILKELGMEASDEVVKLQDTFFVAYASLALIGTAINSTILQLAAGIALSMVVVSAHNFFHKKDTWRRYYFDLASLSSYEWRISHGFSHHLYPNTILDYEILMGEPSIELLPLRPRTLVSNYIIPFVLESLYGFLGIVPIVTRIVLILKGKQKIRPENLIVFVELLIFMMVAPTVMAGIKAWIVIVCFGMFWLSLVSHNGSHHHEQCFHDGDESRPEPDFGLCQLDATASKTDWYHRSLVSVLTTFGEHPLHHLFPTVCHGKLKYLRPILDETLEEFSEEILQFTQWQLLVSGHRQMRRTTPNKFGKNQ